MRHPGLMTVGRSR